MFEICSYPRRVPSAVSFPSSLWQTSHPTIEPTSPVNFPNFPISSQLHNFHYVWKLLQTQTASSDSVATEVSFIGKKFRAIEVVHLQSTKTYRMLMLVKSWLFKNVNLLCIMVKLFPFTFISFLKLFKTLKYYFISLNIHFYKDF